jgi:hypothetical protein
VIVVRVLVRLVSVGFTVSVLGIFVWTSARGWTGIHVWNEPFFGRPGEISKFPGGPAEQAGIPDKTPIQVFSMRSGTTRTEMVPTTAQLVTPLRPDEPATGDMVPTAPPISPETTYTDKPNAAGVYHEIEPSDVTVGDAVYIYLSNNQRALLHVQSPLASGTGLLLLVAAVVAAMLNLIVPLFTWARRPHNEVTILFVVIGTLISLIALSTPLALITFFRGAPLGDDEALWTLGFAGVATLAVVAALLHFAYIFPTPRLVPQKRYLVLGFIVQSHCLSRRLYSTA